MAFVNDEQIEEMNKHVGFSEHVFGPEDLKDSYNYVFLLARIIGWTDEQINKTLRDMYSIGIHGARAGTSLRFILSRLREQDFRFGSIIARIGISYNEIDPRENTFTEILKVFVLKNASIDDVNSMFGRAGDDFWKLLIAYREGKIKDA